MENSENSKVYDEIDLLLLQLENGLQKYIEIDIMGLLPSGNVVEQIHNVVSYIYDVRGFKCVQISNEDLTENVVLVLDKDSTMSVRESNTFHAMVITSLMELQDTLENAEVITGSDINLIESVLSENINIEKDVFVENLTVKDQIIILEEELDAALNNEEYEKAADITERLNKLNKLQ